MKKRVPITLLRFFLGGIWYLWLPVLPLSLAACVINSYHYSNWKNILFNLMFMAALLFTGLIIYHMRRVVRSLAEQNPFTLQNVRSFRIIGIATFITGASILAYNLALFGPQAFYILHLGEGDISTRMGALIFFLLGLFALVLAEIFKSAYEIAEDNKLTV